jgi:putative membrane protein
MKNGLVLVALLILLAVLFLSFFDHGHMWGWEGGMGYGHTGGYLWILLAIIIGLVVYLIIRNALSGPEPGKETALDILKKRFAKGEITKEEFEEMKRKLME